MQPVGTVLVLLFIAGDAFGLKDRSCSNPVPFYNTYINNVRADNCPDGNTAQCVGAVFSLCGAPGTDMWKKNKQVNAHCNTTKRYTAIASFSGTKYDGNKGHAAIFLSCLPGGDIRVVDQWCGHKFSERTLAKKGPSLRPYSACADSFYTFDW